MIDLPEGIVLNGVAYVPLTAYEAKQDEAAKWRKALALAHAYLHFGDPGKALHVIELETGDTFETAVAVMEVLAWAKNVRKGATP